MKSDRIYRHSRWSSQRGQTFIPIIVFIGLFLLAMLGVAVDYSQVWARRQMAQGAADAACQAGAADLFLNATNPSAAGVGGVGPFNWVGATFDCSAKAGTPPCKYASFNGYTGSNVSVSFPSSLPGVAPLPSTFTTAFPYMQVTVTDTVPMTLSQLASSNTSVTITAKAGCGVAPVDVAVPLVVLHQTAAASLSVGGSSSITIFGGPQRSIQVDSSNQSPGAVNVGTVNLTQGGPTDSGSDFGVLGGPSTQPAGITLGSTGHYIFPASPFGDPFVTIPTPSLPSTKGTATPVPFRINGCPDPVGCVEFAAGDYTGCTAKGNINPGDQGCLLLPYSGANPRFNIAGNAWAANTSYSSGTLIQPTKAQGNNGNFVFLAAPGGTSKTGAAPVWPQIVCTPQPDGTCTGATSTVVDGSVTWVNVGTVSLNPSTGIFDPGLYYVASNGLNFGAGSTARMSTAAGDGTNGTLFYFNTSDTVQMGANSGSSSPCNTAVAGTGKPNGCVVTYTVSGALSPAATGYVASRALQCPAGAANPAQVPATIDGNVVLGPCTGTYKSPDGNRGFLFFQNRAVAASGGSCGGGKCALLGGGAGFIFSGFIYFHNGSGATCGTNTSCLQFQGGSGGQSFTLGNIVVDQLSLGGNPKINMILNPTAKFQVLRPTLLE
jgi:hypothetical protein